MIVVSVVCPVCDNESTFRFSARYESIEDIDVCACDRTEQEDYNWTEEIIEKGREEAAEAASYGE